MDNLDPMSVEYSEKIKEVCRLERVIKVPYLTSLEVAGEKIYCNNLYPVYSKFRPYVSHEPNRKVQEKDTEENDPASWTSRLNNYFRME